MAAAVIRLPITALTIIDTRREDVAKLRSEPTDISRYTTTRAKPPNVYPHANSAKWCGGPGSANRRVQNWLISRATIDAPTTKAAGPSGAAFRFDGTSSAAWTR